MMFLRPIKREGFSHLKKLNYHIFYVLIAFFTANKMYIEHLNGNYGLYGLNMIGCDSIIRLNDEILRFSAFVTGKRDAIYTNEKGEKMVVDVYDKSLGITRMMCV